MEANANKWTISLFITWLKFHQTAEQVTRQNIIVIDFWKKNYEKVFFYIITLLYYIDLHFQYFCHQSSALIDLPKNKERSLKEFGTS